MSEQSGFSAYDKKVHNFGLLSSILLILLLIAVPIAVYLISGVEDLDMKVVMGAFLGALAVFGPVAVIEFLSYSPILGAGGMYLSFITGNIMNMKLPAAQSGIKLSGVQPGSKEAEVVSVLSIAISSLVTTAILFLGMLLASQMLPLLQSPVMKPAFDNLMPAIMGALMTPILVKNPKTASLPCALVIILTLIQGYAWVSAKQTYILPLFLIISVAWAYFLYKQGQKKTDKERAAA